MTALTFYPSLNINPMSVIPSFQRRVKYTSWSISVHSVAKFVVGCHIDTKCHMPRSVPPRLRHNLDRLSLILIELTLESLDVNVEGASKPTPIVLRATSKKLRYSLHC